jgi:hypothetical protein
MSVIDFQVIGSVYEVDGVLRNGAIPISARAHTIDTSRFNAEQVEEKFKEQFGEWPVLLIEDKKFQSINDYERLER